MIARWKWIAASGGLGLLVLAIHGAGREQRAAAATPAPARESFEVGLTTAQEVRGMVGAYGQRVEQAERGLADLKTEFAATRGLLEQALAALAGKDAAAEAPRGPESSRFRAFDFGAPESRRVQIPAGSFVEATLLTGVYAPVNGEPLPVLLRLDSALVGPNRTRLPLPRALLVGKAVGDANSRRATIQVESVSIADASGRVRELKANGWVVDEDGLQGLRGSYVWRADEIAGLAAAAGALQAGAEGMAAREGTTTVTPLGGATTAVTGDPLALAGFRAAGGAAARLGEIVADRLKEVVPAILVANGRKVTVAFVNGISIEGLEPREVDHGTTGAPWSGLDPAR